MGENITLGCVNQLQEMLPVAYVIIALSFIIMCHSFLSITVICRHLKLHTITNMSIVSLNVSYLLVALTFLFAGIIYFPGISHLPRTAILLDTFILGASCSSINLTTTHIAIVAVDRCIYITHPFYYMKNITKKRIVNLLCGCWFIAVLTLILPMVAYTRDSYHTKCIFIHPPIEYFSVLAIIYYITLIIVLVSNFKIAHLAYKRKQPTKIKSACAGPSEGVQLHVQSVMLPISSTGARKSFKFFAIMFCKFSLCTLPSGWCIWLNYFVALPYIIYIPCVCLFLVNPIFGFFIHIYMCKDFYDYLKKTVTYKKNRYN